MNEAKVLTGRTNEPVGSKVQSTICLAYADAAHERLSLAYLQTISDDLQWGGSLHLTKWKFEMLGFPPLRKVAAHEAEGASLVVIAAASRSGLPEPVKEWMRAWGGSSSSASGAVVVLLSEASATSAFLCPDYGFLEEQTRRVGRHLVVYATGLPAEENSSVCLRSALQVTPYGLAAVHDLGQVKQFVKGGGAAIHNGQVKTAPAAT
ncbi:MAG TPA: hypothetical protein VEC99_06745 [Clostridia bacterium]|nr:hypothetical protein [Clostridia bacterium]